MASMLDRLLAQDISDSTDFPDDTTTPGLRAFDDALRCSICRDFYDAPVSLNCGHTFCSACIRSALPEQPQCPTCRKPATEVHLRKNVAMETAVQAWQAARPLVLRYAQEEQKRKEQPETLPHNRPDPNASGHAGRKRRRLASPGPSASSDDEAVAMPSSPVPSGSSTPDITPLPDLVACPICQKDVPSSSINMHIDSGCKRYLSEGSASAPLPDAAKSKQKQQWSRLLAGGGGSAPSKGGKGKGKGKGKSRATPDPLSDTDAEQHLPKVAYDIHPQKRIAEMLAAWDLPAHGDKAALARRHARWVVLYNANVDRAARQRRTLEQLRQDLRRAEDAEGRGRRVVVEDAVAYQRANKAAFARLTEAARPKKPAAAKAGSPGPDGAGSAGAEADGQTRDGRSTPVREVIDVDEG
ncbi:hypothetical protein DICSQDRAFT_126359 [Dichomitus squalens LYAD-421 SS1]|uniref:uncharacterized protein n=1 Tax=Dichomitus squalens (strain LYAD-421) TaxID=732165 RepID=UPI0004412EA4|nr:uncharacterized protein DICSQDRAFT_126359 [Dichomitus squalens LYAD-421 SS1]EJF62641.1 hypothetical protein DICSQDRAFT_126359 [Dichomitus squalens LYAD-421 SS1]